MEFYFLPNCFQTINKQNIKELRQYVFQALPIEDLSMFASWLEGLCIQTPLIFLGSRKVTKIIILNTGLQTHQQQQFIKIFSLLIELFLVLFPE